MREVVDFTKKPEDIHPGEWKRAARNKIHRAERIRRSDWQRTDRVGSVKESVVGRVEQGRGAMRQEQQTSNKWPDAKCSDVICGR